MLSLHYAIEMFSLYMFTTYSTSFYAFNHSLWPIQPLKKRKTWTTKSKQRKEVKTFIENFFEMKNINIFAFKNLLFCILWFNYIIIIIIVMLRSNDIIFEAQNLFEKSLTISTKKCLTKWHIQTQPTHT